MKELEKYYRENFDTLCKRMGRACDSATDGEDVVQDAFERAIKYYASYNPHADFERWFSIILSNCLKAHKSRTRMGAVSKPIEEHYDDLEPVVPDDIRSITKVEIRNLIDNSSEPRKEILRLTFDFGYKPSEITCLVKGLTKSQIKRTLELFRKEVLEIYK